MTIIATFNYHPHDIISHDSQRDNVYFMQMDVLDDIWTNVDGVNLKLPLTLNEADEHALVVDTKDVRLGTCSLDSDGHPHLIYRKDKQMRFSRWTNGAWHESTVVSELSMDQDYGDLLVETPSSIRVLIAQTINGTHGVGWWNSINGGLDWKFDSDLVPPSKTGEYLFSSFVRNFHPDAWAILSEVNNVQDDLYQKMYLVGNNGKVTRGD